MNALGYVPLDVRRKLQVLLLIRHGSLGREVTCLQDDYLVYYKEMINPSMYNFKDWDALLKSIPEVTVKKVKRCKVAFAEPLPHDFAIHLLARVFSVEDSSVAGTSKTAGTPNEPVPVDSVDSFIEGLLAEKANAPDKGQNVDGNSDEAENCHENVSSSCPDFPVTFEIIPKTEISPPNSPSYPGQPVVAAADSGSQTPPEDEGQAEEKILPTLNPGSQLPNGGGGNTEETNVEDSLVGNSNISNIQASEIRDHSATMVDSVEKMLPSSSQTESDDEIEVVYESLNTVQATPAVKIEKTSPFDAIPRKCTFRPHRDRTSRITSGNNNGDRPKPLAFKADDISNQKTVHADCRTSTKPPQVEPSNLKNEAAVKVEVKTESSNEENSIRVTLTHSEESEKLELAVKTDEITPTVTDSLDRSLSDNAGMSNDNPNPIDAVETSNPGLIETTQSTFVDKDVTPIPDLVGTDIDKLKHADETLAPIPIQEPAYSSVITEKTPLGDALEAPVINSIVSEEISPADHVALAKNSASMRKTADPVPSGKNPAPVEETADHVQPEKHSASVEKTADPVPSRKNSAPVEETDDHVQPEKHSASMEKPAHPVGTNEYSSTVIKDSPGIVITRRCSPLDDPMDSSDIPPVSSHVTHSTEEVSISSCSSSECTNDSDTSSRLSDSSLVVSFSDCEFWGPSNSNLTREEKSKQIEQKNEKSTQNKTTVNNNILSAPENSSKNSANVTETTPRPRRNLPRKRPAETPLPASSSSKKRLKREIPGTSTSAKSRSTGSRVTNTSAGSIVTDVNWFIPDISKRKNFEDHLYIFMEKPVSVEPYLDRKATNEFVEVEGYGFNVDVQKICEMRNDKNPSILCFHQFWSLTPQCKESSFANLWKDNQEIPKLSFDAIQLLNVDADTDYALSPQPQHTNGQLEFATSYGKYEEYFMCRKESKYKGFGLMPTSFHSTDDTTKSPELYFNNFFPFAGTDQVDIMEPSTMADFEEFVQSNILSAGLDIFVAKGISHPSITHRSQDLCLTQFLLALTLLREGGNFILKLEDTLTCFGVNLLFLMSRCFDQIAIHKPVSALPGERFVICKSKLPIAEVKPVRKFLKDCYNRIVENRWTTKMEEISRLFVLNSSDFFKHYDPDFLDYVKMQNNSIATAEWNEWNNFKRKAQSVTSKKHKESFLLDLTEERNRIWKKWNKMKPLDIAVNKMSLKYESSNSKPEIYWKSIFGNNDAGILDRFEKSVTTAVKRYHTPLGHMNQWEFVPSSGRNNRFIILACEDVVYKYDDKSWKVIPHLQLTKGTVLYGELIQRASPSLVLSIIDAAMIGLEDIRHLSFIERRGYCARFANDMDTPFNLEYRVICAEIMNLRDLNLFLTEIAKEKDKFNVRNSGNQLMDTVSSKSTLVQFKAVEALLLKTRRAPVEESTKDVIGNSADSGDFGFVLRNRLFWEWNPRSDLNVTATDVCSEITEDFATALFEYLAENAKN